MSSSENLSIFVAALLYSNNKISNKTERKLFSRVRNCILNDKILREAIHLINIDNDFSRDILLNNSSGVRVYNWPVFAIRDPQCKKPKIKMMYQANEVFKQVYFVYNEMLEARHQPSTKKQPPQLEIDLLTLSEDHLCSHHKHCFTTDFTSEFTSEFTNNSSDDSRDNYSNNKNYVEKSNDSKFDDQSQISEKEISTKSSSNKSEYSYISEDYDLIIHWNLTKYQKFSEYQKIRTCPGEKILFISEDGLKHDLTLTTEKWELPGKTLAPGSKNLFYVLSIPQNAPDLFLNFIDGYYPKYMKCQIHIISHESQIPNSSGSPDFSGSPGSPGFSKEQNDNSIEMIQEQIISNFSQSKESFSSSIQSFPSPSSSPKTTERSFESDFTEFVDSEPNDFFEPQEKGGNSFLPLSEKSKVSYL